MIESRTARDVFTNLQAGDVLSYNHEHFLVKITRQMTALHLRRDEDKQSLDLVSYSDFVNLCQLVAHVSGLTIGKFYAPRKKQLRCQFGKKKTRTAPMPLRSGDVIRYDFQDAAFDIERDGESMYHSANEFMLNPSNFLSLATILASVCCLEIRAVGSPHDRCYCATVQGITV